MIYIGIDPGPTKCGLVVYRDGRVLKAAKDANLARVMSLLCCSPCHIAIERMQSYGIAGGSLLETARVAGRLEQRALDRGHTVTTHYRREVLKVLDVTGRGNRDALVRQRLIEMHGGTKEVAVGLKKTPGPLYGVSGHAWQALGVAITAKELSE